MNDGYFLSRTTIKLGKKLCVFCLVLAVLNIAGRFFDIDLLTKLHNELPSMTPNTTIGIILFSAAIYMTLDKRKNQRLKYISYLGLLMSCFGLFTLLEYIFHFSTNVDTALIVNPDMNRGMYPGRPSVIAASNFLLLGLALYLRIRRPDRLFYQHLALIIIGICLIVITGYLFSTTSFHGFPIFKYAAPMALNTALAFELLSIALLCTSPRRGLMRVLTGNTQSGHFARVMTVAMLTLPPVLGALTRIGTMTGFFSLTLQISLFMLLLLIVFTFLTWRMSLSGEAKEIEILTLNEKLRLNEENTKLVVNQASDGIFTANLEGKYIDVNESACRLLGYERDELIGMYISDVMASEEKTKLDLKLKNIRLRSNHELSEWTLLKKDGTHIHVEINDTLLRDGRWIGIARDVTDKIQAREALMNSERKFRGFLESARDPILIINDSGNINFVNQQVEFSFGYKRDELLGKNFHHLIPVSQELTGIRKDGTTFPVSLTLSPYDTSEGRLVTVIIRDISDTKKREKEGELLAILGQKLIETLDLDRIISDAADLLVPTMADCCVIRLIDENGVFTLKKVSNRFPEKTQDFINFIKQSESSKELQCFLSSLISSGQPIYSLAGDFKHGSNNPKIQKMAEDLGIHSYVVVPLIPRNNVAGSLSFFMTDPYRKFLKEDISFLEDIGHRIALSMENAKLYKDATQAIKTREEVLSIVSHDLKSPVAALKMRLEFLKRNTHVSPEKLNESFGKISMTLDHMQCLISNILDFAKLESGTFSLDRADHTLKEIILPLIEIIEPEAAARNIHLHTHIPEAKENINCDAVRIRQVLSNLIGNALKFTPASGRIDVSAQNIDGKVIFCVSDTGRGIVEDDLKKIFEKFWQSSDTKKMGSGLGLSICKAIVEAHRGKIWATSELNKGSRFYFTLTTQS